MEAPVGNRFPVKNEDGKDYAFMTCSAPRTIAGMLVNKGCPMYDVCRLPQKGRHNADECNANGGKPGHMCDGTAHPIWIYVEDKVKDGGTIIGAHCAKWYSEIREDRVRFSDRIDYKDIAGGLDREVMKVVKDETGTRRLEVQDAKMIVLPEAILGDEANDTYRPGARRRGRLTLAEKTLGKRAERRASDEFGPAVEEPGETVGPGVVETTVTHGAKTDIANLIKGR